VSAGASPEAAASSAEDDLEKPLELAAPLGTASPAGCADAPPSLDARGSASRRFHCGPARPSWTAASAASGAFSTAAPASGGSRPASTSEPPASQCRVRARSRCTRSLSSVSVVFATRRCLRTRFSMCAAVPWRAILISNASLSGRATRVMARTLE